jgi:hypothetical protein
MQMHLYADEWTGKKVWYPPPTSSILYTTARPFMHIIMYMKHKQELDMYPTCLRYYKTGTKRRRRRRSRIVGVNLMTFPPSSTNYGG